MILSVITVCYNSEQFIERTIKSVIALKEVIKEMEYIIIDGKSTDSTMSIVSKYSNFIDVVISESDQGIYDAMNKGLTFAKGDWVSFMNSGDTFYQPYELLDVVNILRNNVETIVVYGNWIIDFGNRQVLMKAESIKRLESRMPFNHQASFVRKQELMNNPFDLSFRIAADYNFFYHLYRGKGSNSFFYCDKVIALCDATDSTSFNHLFDLDLEHHRITSDNKSLHWRIAGIKIFLKRILGLITGNKNIRLNPFWKQKTFFEK